MQVSKQATEVTDIFLLAMCKHGVMRQDPADADNFIFVKLPKKVYAQRMAAAVTEAEALVSTLDADIISKFSH